MQADENAYAKLMIVACGSCMITSFRESSSARRVYQCPGVLTAFLLFFPKSEFVIVMCTKADLPMISTNFLALLLALADGMGGHKSGDAECVTSVVG